LSQRCGSNISGSGKISGLVWQYSEEVVTIV
jgi:hypothetical protein